MIDKLTSFLLVNLSLLHYYTASPSANLNYVRAVGAYKMLLILGKGFENCLSANLSYVKHLEVEHTELRLVSLFRFNFSIQYYLF